MERVTKRVTGNSGKVEGVPDGCGMMYKGGCDDEWRGCLPERWDVEGGAQVRNERSIREEGETEQRAGES